MQVGDIVISIDGQEVDENDVASMLIGSDVPGTRAHICANMLHLTIDIHFTIDLVVHVRKSTGRILTDSVYISMRTRLLTQGRSWTSSSKNRSLVS
jgi:hypothetical protein